MTGTADQQDRELVRRIVERRSEAAFRMLYRRHTPRLFGFATRLAGPEGEPDELVHETWLRVTRALPSFRWDSSLGTWMRGVLLNCHREACRRRARLRLVDTDVETLPEHGSARGAEDRVDLERALARLPVGYRRIVVLHDVEGYTHQEIGRLLGIDPGTSKSQLSRGRARLRAMLGRGSGRSSHGETA
jgi:RNA polymerase sigma-70 factor (ECF subfamily)